MSSSKKSSRWSRFAGSSTSSEDFYSTDSDPIALTRGNEPQGQIAGLEKEKKTEKASMGESQFKLQVREVQQLVEKRTGMWDSHGAQSRSLEINNLVGIATH